VRVRGKVEEVNCAACWAAATAARVRLVPSVSPGGAELVAEEDELGFLELEAVLLFLVDDGASFFSLSCFADEEELGALVFL